MSFIELLNRDYSMLNDNILECLYSEDGKGESTNSNQPFPRPPSIRETKIVRTKVTAINIYSTHTPTRSGLRVVRELASEFRLCVNRNNLG